MDWVHSLFRLALIFEADDGNPVRILTYLQAMDYKMYNVPEVEKVYDILEYISVLSYINLLIVQLNEKLG